MKTILFHNDGIWHDEWLAAIARHMPGRTAVEYSNVSNVSEIEYALTWKHPHGSLKNYPNLKAVFSLGSGVDHFDADNNLPDVPIFRLIDPAMADDMALYTLHWTIHFQRQFSLYKAQQNNNLWNRFLTPLAPDFNVTVLGLGAIGSHIAQVLAKNGFNVSGWSRSPKDIAGINAVSGSDGLSQILGNTDTLVCCLPLNKSTHHFLGHEILSQLKKGGHLINVSRGGLVDDEGLLALLDSGHIAGAALDVFGIEPLPESSPYWQHPNVHVTPHMSGATNPDTGVEIIAKDIALFESGGTPLYPYVREG